MSKKANSSKATNTVVNTPSTVVKAAGPAKPTTPTIDAKQSVGAAHAIESPVTPAVAVKTPVNVAALAHVRSFFAKGYVWEYGQKKGKSPILFIDLPALLGYDLQGDQFTYAMKTFHSSCSRNKAVGGSEPTALWDARKGAKVDEWGPAFGIAVELADMACRLGAMQPVGTVKNGNKEVEKLRAQLAKAEAKIAETAKQAESVA